MCSIGSDSELPREPEYRENVKTPKSKCMKCANKAVCIARVKDPFCRECFLSYFVHRFRSTVGKARIFEHEEKVLMAYSGGSSSTALLRVVQEGLVDRSHKRLRFIPSVVVVDEGAVHGHSEEESLKWLAQRVALALNMGYAVYFTSLEEVYGQQRAWDAFGLLRLQGEGFGCLSGRETAGKKSPSSKGLSDSEAKPNSPQGPKITADDTSVHESQEVSNGGDLKLSLEGSVVSQTNSDPNPVKSAMSTECEQKVTDCTKAVESPEPSSNQVSLPDDQDDETASNPLAVCFADEDCITSKRGAKPRQLAGKVIDQAQIVLPTAKVSKEEVLRLLRTIEFDKKAHSSLKEFFSSLTTLTAKQDLLRTLRHQLLVCVARKTGLSKVLTGDNETELAVRLLSCVAQGRGATIPLDTGFTDERSPGVTMVRPMREFPCAEITTYCDIWELELVTYPVLGSLAPKDASIEKMTEGFIHGLLVNFPNTVNTVFRTGDKISMGRELSSKDVCSLCHSPLGSSTSRKVAQTMKQSIPPSSLRSSSTSASSFLPISTSNTSTPSGDGKVGEKEAIPTCECQERSCEEGMHCSTRTSHKSLHIAEIESCLCYGCQLTLRDLKSGTELERVLPDHVLREADLRQQRAEMKARIQDFLIGNNDADDS